MAVDVGTRTAIDDVFNDNFSDFEDDPFADKPTLKDQRDDKPVLSPRPAKRKADEDGDIFGLGLDQEVKIAKKRRPVAKLDEARLLSEPGIPKIRSLIRSKQCSRKLRLKGKGHEFTDTAKLLNYYQLWLDNLYPRAKFADALKMVEKAGHTKRMQMTRNEWINESKPGYIRNEIDSFDVETHADKDMGSLGSGAIPDETTVGQGDSARQLQSTSGADDLEDDSLFIPDAHHHVEEDEQYNDPDDDELDALLAANNETRSTIPAPRQDDSEGEDDLDALLAEQDARQIRRNLVNEREQDVEEEEEEDELDALLAEQESRQTSSLHVAHDQASSLPHIKETMSNQETNGTTMQASATDEEQQTDLPSTPRSQQSPANTKPATTPPSQELVDDNLSPSSSPLPNNEDEDEDIEKGINNINETNIDNDDDDATPAPTANQTEPIQAAELEPESELVTENDGDHQNSRNETIVIDGLEMEEDFLASSPIDS